MADWGKILVGVVSAAGTIYAAREQKKAQQAQYDYEQRMLQERRDYANQQVAAAQNTPAAKIAPYLMKATMQLYGDKLKKYGVDLPLEDIFNALGFGTGSALSGSMSGTLSNMSPEQKAAMKQKVQDKFGGVNVLTDPDTGQSIMLANRMSTGTGRKRTQYKADFDGGDPYDISGIGGGGAPSFDSMFKSQHDYMKSQGMLGETLISPEQMAEWNLDAREFANAHPLADKAGQWIFNSLLGAVMPGPTIFGAGKGLYNQYVKGDDSNITDVFGELDASGNPVVFINGIPQYGDDRLAGRS